MMTSNPTQLPNSVEEQMLSAIELFHYSYKFKGHIIVILLAEAEQLNNILPDLRVLHSSHLKTVLLLQASQKVESELKLANLKGQRFNFIAYQKDSNYSNFCLQSWQQDYIPVIAHSDGQAIFQWSLNFAKELKASKYYYLQEREGLFGAGKFISYSTSEDLLSSLDKTKYNFKTILLKDLCNFQLSNAIDVGIVAAKSGSLFQEIFTHRGSGTLISGSYTNAIRQATVADIADIQFLLLPYIRNEAVLPISDQQILEDISSFYVYTINNAIVAVAKINNYGEACEISKFCTLPRYQRKGRARRLLLELMQIARQKNYDYLFLLSREPNMWSFLNSLNFNEVTYSELPTKWLEQYDTKRGSKAFKIELKK